MVFWTTVVRKNMSSQSPRTRPVTGGDALSRWNLLLCCFCPFCHWIFNPSEPCIFGWTQPAYPHSLCSLYRVKQNSHARTHPNLQACTHTHTHMHHSLTQTHLHPLAHWKNSPAAKADAVQWLNQVHVYMRVCVCVREREKESTQWKHIHSLVCTWMSHVTPTRITRKNIR